MASRLDLQSKLEELLNSNEVYYKPPKNTMMSYPAIRYNLKDIVLNHADDSSYTKRNRYEVIVIDKKPDNPVISKLLDLPYCSYDRQYVAENLYHDVLTLYW